MKILWKRCFALLISLSSLMSLTFSDESLDELVSDSELELNQTTTTTTTITTKTTLKTTTTPFTSRALLKLFSDLNYIIKVENLARAEKEKLSATKSEKLTSENISKSEIFSQSESLKKFETFPTTENEISKPTTEKISEKLESLEIPEKITENTKKLENQEIFEDSKNDEKNQKFEEFPKIHQTPEPSNTQKPIASTVEDCSSLRASLLNSTHLIDATKSSIDEKSQKAQEIKFLSLDFAAKALQFEDDLIDEPEMEIYRNSSQLYSSVAKSISEEVEELEIKLLELRKISEEIQTKILIQCKRK